MSKSKGNFFTIKDLLDRGHRPEAIRYLLAGSHYRKPLNFGFEGLEQAAAALERIHGLVVRLDELTGRGARRLERAEPRGRCGAGLPQLPRRRSTRRSRTISTPPRRWPRCTPWSAGRTP